MKTKAIKFSKNRELILSAGSFFDAGRYFINVIPTIILYYRPHRYYEDGFFKVGFAIELHWLCFGIGFCIRKKW